MQMRIREMTRADAEQLLGVYRRFAREHVGLASRDVKAFKRLLRRKENMGWVAEDERGTIFGYVTARFDKKERHARIVEIVVDPAKSFEDVARPLVDRAHASLLEKTPAKITAGSIRNPYYAEIFPRLGFFGAESTGVLMYSIVDVAKFLAEISPILVNRLKQLKQWSGILQLECEEQSRFFKKQQDDVEPFLWTNQAPDFRITSNRELLTKLLFGIADAVEFFEKEQLTVETTLNRKRTSQVLAAIFPKKQFLIMDFW